MASTQTPPDGERPNFRALRVRLARLRDAQGITYDELASRTGLSRRSIVALASGEVRNGQPTEGTLTSWYLIAHALGVSVGDLVDALEESPVPEGSASLRPVDL